MLDDQIDLLRLFNAFGVRYLTLGGHAVSMHSEPRGTKDLDLLVANDPSNGRLVFQALRAFGASLLGVTEDDFVGQPDLVFQIGVPPARIDIMQSASGIDFESAWDRRVETFATPDTPLHLISEEDLITNKTASGRLQDLADVERIQKAVAARKGASSGS